MQPLKSTAADRSRLPANIVWLPLHSVSCEYHSCMCPSMQQTFNVTAVPSIDMFLFMSMVVSCSILSRTHFIASFSMALLEDTSLTFTVSVSITLFVSVSITEQVYTVQYLALYPGESHLPSPLKRTPPLTLISCHRASLSLSHVA